MKLNIKKKKESNQKMGRRPKQIFLQRRYIRWPRGTWKDAQHHQWLEKDRSKLQWDMTSHWTEWPSSKNLQTMNAGEGVEKREPSYTVGGNVNWCSHYEKVWTFLKKLKTELPDDSTVPLLGLYPEKTINWKDICTQHSLQHYLQSQDIRTKKMFCIQWNTTQPSKRTNNALCSNTDGLRLPH